MSHYPPGEEPTTERIASVLAEVIEVLEAEDVPHLLMGGAGAQTFARPRQTDDIDVFVEPGDARRALDVLEKGVERGPSSRHPLIAERRITFVKLGTHVRIPERALDEFIAASTVEAAE